MAVRLPQELIDYVIDFLYHKNYALYACSLVCHDWLPTSRYHKFRYAVIGYLNRKGDGLKTFDTCPIAAGYVRDLTIQGGRARGPIPDFSNCVKLRSLTLGSIDVSPMKIDFESISSSPASRSVTDLTLRTCITTCEDLGRFLCAFSHLDSLKIVQIRPRPARRIEDENIRQFESSPPFSGHLTIYDDFTNVIKLLLSFPRGIHFSSIVIGAFDQHLEFNMLLMACGSSLETLTIGSDARLRRKRFSENAINFRHNDNLRELTWRDLETLPLESLSTIASPVLLKLMLTFSWDRATYQRADWDGLDRLLSQAQFRALRLTIWNQGDVTRDVIRNEAELARIVRLPQLRSRGGLLRFRCV